MDAGKSALRRCILSCRLVLQDCPHFTCTSHALHMQAHLCHRTLLLCDLTRRSLGFHQPVVTVQASWFPPTMFTSFDGNVMLSWLKGFCLVSIGRFETNSTCTHQVSYKGRSDSFHQKTILISPLICHGAPYICMSSSYSLIKPCIQHLYHMYKVCSKSEWMSWIIHAAALGV